MVEPRTFLFILALSCLSLVSCSVAVTEEKVINPKYYPPAPNLGTHRHLQSLPEERHSYKYSYKRVNFNALFMIPDGLTDDEDCIKRPGSSIDEFPEDLFTQQQRQRGAILLHFIGAIYFFSMLAIICDKYFLPSVECICEDLNISQDVAAATFMATATTIPEFFTNTISTFIAESDMGLGTIIGSMLFNTLGVAACASMAAMKPIQMDWWPITRDCIMFSINVSILVTIVWDGRVYWYETVVLVTMYFIYWIIMFQNPRIMKCVKSIVEDRWNWCKSTRSSNVSQVTKKKEDSSESHINEAFNGSVASLGNEKSPQELESNANANMTIQEEDEEVNLWKIPDTGKVGLLWYFYSWPIRFILTFTIPNPARMRRWYPLTFIMCIVWLAGTSYFVFWMVVIIGYTFSIPEPVMGLTLLAMGGCLPEAISAVIVARSGNGGMGVSNALGANSLAVLFSLGLPWFIRNMADGAGRTNAFINIYSFGIEFTILSLLLAIAMLYIIIALAGYKLRKAVGGILFCVYTIFVTMAILTELDVFWDVNRC